ncbi:MAG: hypothetical protein KF850_02870 [Labilithrix sp.]|nr:hypothetical protein [Labilithrix sp.]
MNGSNPVRPATSPSAPQGGRARWGCFALLVGALFVLGCTQSTSGDEGSADSGAAEDASGARPDASVGPTDGGGATECAIGNGGCDPLATCTKTATGRTCTCPTGYTTADDGVTCDEIDECLVNNGGCSAAATCENTPGSRTCVCGRGYTTTDHGITCTDVDECLVANGGCSVNATCKNTPGSRTCTCLNGYASTDDGVTCTDVDECLVANGGCAANATCDNTLGARTCTCPNGYATADQGITCDDIDECLADNGGCAPNANCTNTPGARTCACPNGFTTNDEGVTCTDVDECLVDNGGCAPNATCTNTPGSRACACPNGYTTTDEGVTCTDIDECLVNNGGCSAAATCENTPGSRTCACAAGYTTTDAGLTCNDVNECLTDNGGCDARATCTNTLGSRICTCAAGWASTDGGATCDDVDECLTGNGGCDAHATCTNTIGSRACACDSGWRGPGTSCVDVDECLTGNGGCHVNATCTNTPGAHDCTCNAGYEGSGIACTDVDDCSPNPCNNGGTCTDRLLGFTCACRPDYYDATCSTYDPPPGPVIGFTYSEHGRVGLHWKPPADPDWRNVRIVRKTASAPASPTDGTVVYEGRERFVFDATAIVATAYHYAAYTYDDRGSVSTPARISFTPSWILRRFTASADVARDPQFPYFTVHAWGAGGGGRGANGGGGGYATSYGQILPGETWRAMVGRGGDYRGTGGYNGTEDIGRGGLDRDIYIPSGGQMSGFFRKPGSGVPTAISEWSVIAGGGGASGSLDAGMPGGGGGSPGSGVRPGLPGANGLGGASSVTQTAIAPGLAFADGGHGATTATCSATCGGPGGGGYGGGGAGRTVSARGNSWAGGGGGGNYARNANGLTSRTTNAGAYYAAEEDSPFYPTDGSDPARGGPANTGGRNGHVVVVLTRCPGNMGGPTCSDVTAGSAPVTELRASTGAIVLGWKLPPDAVDAIRIFRSTTAYATTPDDETVLVDVPGTETSFADPIAVPGVYYYSLFTRNAAGVYSSVANVTGEMCTVCRMTASNAIVVPDGMASMTVKAWGAGGGGGYDRDMGYRSSAGGGGGFSSSTTAVSPGETFRAIVGGAGSLAFVGAPGEGYNGVDDIGRGGISACRDGATGGQMSGVVRVPLSSAPLPLAIGDWLAIAGGGGGGHGSTRSTGAAGAGGGIAGQAGQPVQGYTAIGGTGGQGGVGGTAGSDPNQDGTATAGSSWSDGGRGGRVDSRWYGFGGPECGGAGGGGYGGGGGSARHADFAAGGGGGGGYAPNGGTTSVGNFQVPANTADPDYPAGWHPGYGGNAVTWVNWVPTNIGLGGNGYVVVRFQ